MIKVACDYNIKEDIGFILESEKINNIEFAERAKVSRTTLEGIVKKGIARDDVCEKIYASHIIINIGLIRLRKN